MTEPFATDTAHASYDPEYVGRFHEVPAVADETLKTFSGWFNGKSSPVHLFWHSFDLALTRFSGRRAPEMPAADPVTREAYSHEVISFGFWTGDATVPAPAFYSYTDPNPQGLRQAAAACRSDVGAAKREPLAYCVRGRAQQCVARQAVLAFLESAYQAGAELARWDVAALRSSFAPTGPIRV